jgi:hypothetical protein
MLRRLLVGLLFGAIIGASAAAFLIGWLKASVFEGPAGGAVEAYGASLAVGVLAGLVTGKPIWASDAKVEAGIKAAFGALLAAGGMFAMRRWAPSVNLVAPLGSGGPALLGQLPASLTIVGAALGALFEVDNTEGAASAKRKDAMGVRVPSQPGARRVVREPSSRSHADEESTNSSSNPRSKRAGS